MEEYYFLNVKNEQFGPLTLEELQNSEITGETLIWAEGMDEWKKIREIPNLMEKLKLRRTPPPPPQQINQDTNNKTEITGNINVTKISNQNEVIEAIKPSITSTTWLIIWISFQSLALLFSYSKIEIFNRAGFYHTYKFWPFVDFVFDYENGNTYFYGIFHEYDWTEFLFYTGSGIIVYLIVKLSKKKKDEKI